MEKYIQWFSFQNPFANLSFQNIYEKKTFVVSRESKHTSVRRGFARFLVVFVVNDAVRLNAIDMIGSAPEQ